MLKLSQYDNPILTTPLQSEKQLVDGVWNKFLADKHAKIITLIKGAIGLPAYAKLKEGLLKQFPLGEDFWKQFAYAPLDLSLEQIKDGMDRLTKVPELELVAGAKNALNMYLDQYKIITDHLHKQQNQPKKKAPQEPGKPIEHNLKNPSRKPRPALPKEVAKLQSLLNVNPTGIWDKPTNDMFLKWLYDNGWQNYIVNNRFVGDINAAINAIMIEKASPEQ